MKTKLLSIFALLLMSATGAMAQTEELLTTITPTETDTYSETTPGVVTVTHDNSDFYDEYGWVWWENPGSVTVVANEGYTITKCVFYQNGYHVATISSSPFKINFIYNDVEEEGGNYCEGTDPADDLDGVSSIEVYGLAGVNTIVWDSSTRSFDNRVSCGGLVQEDDECYLMDGLFTTSLGNFTKIEVSGGYFDVFSYPTGWNDRTWTGNASSVAYDFLLDDEHGTNPFTITFYIEPSSGDATGINTIPQTVGSDAQTYYDLQGRRIEKPTKGIYIVNGKKVVKK